MSKTLTVIGIFYLFVTGFAIYEISILKPKWHFTIPTFEVMGDLVSNDAESNAMLSENFPKAGRVGFSHTWVCVYAITLICAAIASLVAVSIYRKMKNGK